MNKILKFKRKRLTIVIDNVTVHVIKIKNPKTGEWDYFASNLPLRLVNEKQLRTLYRLRWEVETAFRDFPQTIKLEQWHSKFINGIRQELYVALVLYNFVKLKILSKLNTAKECMRDTYKRPNFKLLFGWVTSRLYEIVKGVRGVLKGFEELCTGPWKGEPTSPENMKERSNHRRAPSPITIRGGMGLTERHYRRPLFRL